VEGFAEVILEPRQGDVYISRPSPLTGERELRVVVTNNAYNDGFSPTRLVAEIETGTRFRPTGFGTETDFGVVLADRLTFYPVDMLGEPFGRLTVLQMHAVLDQIAAAVLPG
jgi:mRNA-degrading endonuclease toxin of MazEF toxin-antitoxin module